MVNVVNIIPAKYQHVTVVIVSVLAKGTVKSQVTDDFLPHRASSMAVAS